MKKEIKKIPSGGAAGSTSQTAPVSTTASDVQTPSAQEPSAAASAASQPCEFEGVSFDRIITALLLRWGIAGEPAEGNRNVTLYRLARELRYICDFSVPRLARIIPSWGLPEQERQQTLASAVASPRGTLTPDDLAAVLKDLRRQERDETTEPQTDENPLPRMLPSILRYFVRRNVGNERATILAALPILGNLLCRLRAEYFDGIMESPIFMTVVVGPQASGKSFLRELYETLGAPMLEADEQQRKKENEYRDRCRKAKNEKKQPELEEFPMRCLPAMVSNTQLLRRVDQNHGLSVLSFASEIDTLKRANSAGAWAQKSDIYRVGFEGGMYGQDFASDMSYSATVELRYNLLLSGTDSAVRGFFRNVENGMMSRFCFAQMADDRGKKLVRKPERVGGVTRDDVVRAVRELYELGSNPSPEAIIVVPLRRTLKALDKWTDDRIAEYMQTANNALDILRRRSCLIGFRAAMVAWAMCGCKETNEVVEFALWVASEVLRQQMAMYGKQLNEQDEENRRIREENAASMRTSRNLRLLDSVPHVFSKSDVACKRAELGMKGECSYVISRWLAGGVVMRRADGMYEKIKRRHNEKADNEPSSETD